MSEENSVPEENNQESIEEDIQEPIVEDNQESIEENIEQKFEESNEEDWQAPPPPEEIEMEEREEPQMSEIGTLANIFIEPGNTFKDLRRKPRFIFAAIIIAILSTGFVFSLQQKVGEESIRRSITQQAEKNSQFAALSQEQKDSSIDLQMSIQKVLSYIAPLFVFIFFLIGGLFYWIGVKAMGGEASFLHTLSVWIYASFPPTVIAVIANFVILFLRSAEDIEYIPASQRGLIKANPTMFFDGKEMPVLTTLISTIDLFAIWGLVLAAIGLKIVGKISTGSAWGIVLIFTLIGITARVIGAFINGVPS